MSLRGKITWLFCGLWMVPLLVLAGFTYWHVRGLAFDVLGPADAERLVGAVGRMQVTYWLFVIGLAGSTVAAFSLLLRGVTANLEALIRASEKIGEGDLNPWLPPPSKDELGRLNLALGRMLERIREMVTEVDRSGRLAAIGQLSSYLAHEIRTPLSATRMNLQRMERWARNGRIPAICSEPVEISLREVDRLTTAVSGILALTRSHDSPLVPMSIHEAVQEAATVLDPEMTRRSVALELELDAHADRVLGRPGQVKGVVLNLLLNAIEAQPRGGKVEISSRLARVSSSEGPMLELRVRDEGPGVPPEIRERIFEPFFTTKKEGSGIGLALAVQSIRENGGEILLEEPDVAGRGAEFVIQLPLAPMAPEEPAVPAPMYVPRWPRRGNAAARALATETLEIPWA